MTFAGLLEVGPYKGDTPETLGIRCCEICGQSVVDDGCDGRPDRTMYYDPLECLDVCENCTEQYLAEKPT